MKADDCKICCLTLDSSQTEMCVKFFFLKLIKEKSWEKNLQNSHNTVFVACAAPYTNMQTVAKWAPAINAIHAKCLSHFLI